MDKIWTSAKVKIRNRLDFIHYGQRIGYINIVAIVIDLAILLYSAIDYQTLMQTGNLFLFLFLVLQPPRHLPAQDSRGSRRVG